MAYETAIDGEARYMDRKLEEYGLSEEQRDFIFRRHVAPLVKLAQMRVLHAGSTAMQDIISVDEGDHDES